MTYSEILQLIQQILEYPLFKINQTEVTPGALLRFLIVLGLFTLFARIAGKSMLSRVLAKLQVEQGTRYSLSRLLQYVIVFVGVIVAFQFIGIDLSGLVVVFGFLSVGIGFGLQNITSNFISGLILLFERPIKVGDRVTVGDTEGDVMEINMRSTTIRSLNNIAIIVPNSEFISSTVVNWSHGESKVRLDIRVGVSYASDLETVLRSLREVAEENNEVLKKPAPEVHLEEFGDSSWNMNLRAWIEDPKRNRQVRSALNCEIVKKFRQNNVEIPFPQRDLHVRSPLPLPLFSSAQQQAHDGASGI